MAAKSSSGAALLLVAAVLLVAGTSTSPAHAVEHGLIDLVNLCDHDALISIGDVRADIEVLAGKTLSIDMGVLGILDPLDIHINGKIYILDLGLLDGLLGSTGVVVKIELVCNDHKCGEGSLALRVYVQVVVGGIEIGDPTVGALICLNLKISI